MANYNKSFNFRNGVQVDDDNFIVNANGLVGIGTSIPTEFLDVHGTAKITGLVTARNLTVTGVSTFYSDVKIGSGITFTSSGEVRAGTFYGSATGLTGIYAIAVDGWHINAGNISTTSKVGIGTTLPYHSLQVGQNPLTGNGFSVDAITGNVYTTGIITAASANITGITTLNNLSATSLQVSGNGSIGTLNANSGIVTTISGTTLTYSGTGRFGTLNANSGIVTTLSGTTLTYGTAGITTLTTTTGTITNLTNTNLISTASTITYLNNTDLRTTGVATIQTLDTVNGDIAYFTGESISVSGNIRGDSLNANSGIVTTISGTTLTYSGTGRFGTLNANSGIVTTLSGTTLTYGTAGITTLTTTTGTITNLTNTNINSTNINATDNVISNTINANSGIVTTISGTTLTYSGTGRFGTLNANSGIVTTLSGTTLTYGTAGITTLTTTTLTATSSNIINLDSNNINVIGIITSPSFDGNLTGIASSATQLYTPREFSIIGNFVSSASTVFDGTDDVGIAATITPNSITLGTYTNGNYVKSITGTPEQIDISNSGFPSAEPVIGLPNDVRINNNLYVTNNIGIGTDFLPSKLTVVGNGEFYGNLTATGIITASSFSGNSTSATYADRAGIATNVIGGIGSITELSVSGVTTSQNGFTSGIGVTNPVKITVSGNILTFTVTGVGSTSLTLY
jgi:hypothetical protein